MDNDTVTLYLIPSSRALSTESDGSTVVQLTTIYTRTEMSTVASSSSSKQMEVNPRGIPKAPFVVCPPASA